MDKEFKVITLCGSTKFKDEFIKVQQELALKGNIVISVDFFENELWENIDEEKRIKIKEMLDLKHRRKIDMADEIFVINVGGYIGESTKLEIEYAKKKGKNINYLEKLDDKKLGILFMEKKLDSIDNY